MAEKNTKEKNVQLKFWARFRLRYRLIALVACIAGLVLHFIESGNVAGCFAQFPVQAGIACLVMFGLLALRDSKGKAVPTGRMYYLLKGMCITAALAAAVLYHIVLKGEGVSGGDITKIILYTALPILAVCDFALFDRKGGYKTRYPFIWLVVPIYYYGFSFLYRALAEAMPYAFMDADISGIGGVALYAVIAAAAYLVLGFVLYAVDHWFAEVRDN